MIVNGVPTASGNQLGISDPFNEIWVGLLLATGDDRDTLEVSSHQYDEQLLNSGNMNVIGGNISDAFMAFKFYDDQETANIAEFLIVGDLLVDTWGERTQEEWTYTVFAVNNPSIPEPAITTILFGLVALVAIFWKKCL